MTLPAGTHIGAFEIVSSLGVGGMGEVYRARDGKLNREVAIKVLLPNVIADPDRIARFRREAQVLASLNHPNIAHIHGIEEADGVTALVLELVEGEDLAERLARGPIALEDAVPIAVQIAEALEAAHDLGITHRDLKPANIKLRPDGTVKVLDFGLAKAVDPHGSSSATAMNSPTLSMHATQAGVILGTAAYMSPEQARGKVVDRRADIWAFGVVLYEMLTGQRPFKGDDVTDILASVLKDTPAFDALPPSTPPQVRWVVERCLQRDPKARLRDIGEARIQLAALSRGDASGGTWQASWFAIRADGERVQPEKDVVRGRRHILAGRLLSIVIGTVALLAIIFVLSRNQAAPSMRPAIVRFTLNVPDDRAIGTLVRSMALSPGGDELAYVTDTQVLRRSLSAFEMQPVAAADLGGNLQTPVYSPDGQWLAYYSGARRMVRRVSINGGAALRVCEGLALSLDWDASGILVGRGAGGVVRCNPAGGAPEQLATVDDGEIAVAPQILPDADTLLFTIAKRSPATGVRWDEARVVVQSLRTGERRTIVDGGSEARFVASGHLIYAVSGVLFAAPFDLDSLSLRGPAVAVVEGVRRGTTGVLQFAMSTAGSLIYLPGATGDLALRQLAIADRSGNISRIPVPPASYSHVRVSRDGRRAAIGVDDGKDAQVLVYALNGASALQRLTTLSGSRFPVWSPDGQWIAFSSSTDAGFGLFRQRADGTGAAERLTTAAAGEEHVPESWAPGDRLSFSVAKGSGSTGWALWMLSLPDKKTTAFAEVRSTDATGSVFSPDGKWLAYSVSMNTGILNANRGIFVQPVPATGAVYQVPRELVDFHPAWSRSGAELVFTASANGGVMAAVSVTHAAGTTFGTPVRFPAAVTGDRVASERRAWDLMPDGRLIGIVAVGDGGNRTLPELRLVVNWFEELKQRVPVQ
jgi:serine/threonine-protein kinase